MRVLRGYIPTMTLIAIILTGTTFSNAALPKTKSVYSSPTTCSDTSSTKIDLGVVIGGNLTGVVIGGNFAGVVIGGNLIGVVIGGNFSGTTSCGQSTSYIGSSESSLDGVVIGGN